MTLRAALYARVSREEQAEGYSLDAQLDAMRRYCDQRGWAITGEYVEPGVSGTTGDRPALRQALATCESHAADVLLTHQLDRLARNLKLQLEILSSLGKWSVAYTSVVEQIDYATPQGALFLSMLGAFNEYYVANLKRETVKGKAGRAQAGLSNASHPPYGYSLQEGRHVPDPASAPVVRWIFETYAAGAHSDDQLAVLLNRRGAPPPAGASGRWTREAVRYILNNPAYAGRTRYRHESYSGQQEPLITDLLWQQVAALRARRSHGQGAGQHPRRVYLLSRLARCIHCGLRLIAAPLGGRRDRREPILYYGCPSRRRCVDCPAAGHWVRCHELDDQAGAIVSPLRLPEDWRARLTELQEEQPAQDIEAERRRIEGRLARLHDVYIAGDLSQWDYQRRRAQLRAELADLAPAEAGAAQGAGEVIATLSTTWAVATQEQRRELLRALFEAIYVDPLTRRIVSLRPHADLAVLFVLSGMEVQSDGTIQAPAPAAAG